MLEGDSSESWRTAFRIELRAEAIGLAGRGWPVLPGTYPELTDHPEVTTKSNWSGPVPAHEDWREHLFAHPNEVAELWTGEPYSVLVATGSVLDAVEVDDALGRAAARLLRSAGQPAPIVATPNRRWLFLTGLTSRLPAELAEQDDIRWHGADSWVPLPPTPYEHGVVHWRVKPEVWGWQLPPATVVHDVLVRALASQTSGAQRYPAAEASAA